MKVKPKEVLLNLPVALLFDEPWEVANFAANINTILHGKVRLKAEELGTLGGRHVGLFYLQRNNESQQIHDEFIRLIEEEQAAEHGLPPLQEDPMPQLVQETHELCKDCNNTILHEKELDHCICGEDWVDGKCLVDHGKFCGCLICEGGR